MTEMAPEYKNVCQKLLAYCETNNWAGYEPYDATNSRLFTAFPFLNTKIVRLPLTQALKRSPIDIRRFLLIEKTQNPKALALFLSSLLKLSKAGVGNYSAQIEGICARLVELRSPDVQYWCWGYSFPWQTRTILVPRWAPNLVCTAFVAGALLDLYEDRQEERWLEIAASSARYILDTLYWERGDVAGFDYPLPGSRNQVHNANFLAAELCCRVYKHTGDDTYLKPALKAARYSASQQRADGGWDYGEAASQKWIDNFHTGFDLSALQSMAKLLNSSEFDAAIRHGFEFYKKHFFREDGAVRYYHDRTYPIDAHCFAQAVITLLDLKHLDQGNVALAQSVLDWAIKHMWDERGFFYYRVLRSCTIRTSYIRWTQAWMLLALVRLIVDGSQVDNSVPRTSMTSA
jgi:hypothetical protein